MGPTAYSAVYTENPGSLSIAEPDVATSTDDPSYLPALSAEKIQEGANILAMLKDLPLYRRLTQRRFDLYGGIIVPRPVFQIWVDDLWAEFGPVLSDCDPDQLLRLSEMVFRNTRRPFKTHGRMNATDWAKAASGRNVRWEVIGIVISLVGLVAVNLDDWDSIFDDVRDKIIDRATFGERMGKASGHCLCFCYVSATSLIHPAVSDHLYRNAKHSTIYTPASCTSTWCLWNVSRAKPVRVLRFDACTPSLLTPEQTTQHGSGPASF